MSRNMIKFAVCLAFGTTVQVASIASAATGTVTGSVHYWNELSDECVPTSSNSNCLGAYYTASQRLTARPLRGGHVYVVDSASTATIWGAGVSDGSGAFTINWAVTGSSTTIRRARIVFETKHSTGAFWVEDSSGNIPRLVSAEFFLQPTSTPGSPQVIPPVQWGQLNAPNESANFYAGGEMVWTNHFSLSNILLNTMRTILKYGPGHGADMHAGNPGTGHFDTTPQRMDNGLIGHEMGHNAEYRAAPGGSYSNPVDLNYGSYSNGWHSWNTAEWGHVQFSEGFADFAEFASVYSVWSINPTLNGVNIEISDCNVPEGASRTEKSVAGFLWDLYDMSNAPLESDMWRNTYHMYDLLRAYGGGTDNHDKNEPWNHFVLTIDDRDGHSGYDYREVAIREGWPATAVLNAYIQNCSVVGD